MSRNLKGAMVQLVAQLADTKISTGDLLGLRIGDVITTDKDVHDPLVLSVEGVPKFRGPPGAFKGPQGDSDRAVGRPAAGGGCGTTAGAAPGKK